MEKKIIEGKHAGSNLPKSGVEEQNLTKPVPIQTVEPKPKVKKAKKSNPPPDYSPDAPLEFSKWMSTKQLLEDFPVSRRSLYNWRQKSLLPFTFFEGKLVYDRTAFEKILKSRWNIGMIIIQAFLGVSIDMDIGAWSLYL